MELRKLNTRDAAAQWAYTTALPADENGLTNPWHGVSYAEYMEKVLPALMAEEHPVNMPDWFVPQTYYYLWDGGRLVGEFRIRHYLTEALRNGAGHIGYSIRREDRGRGYGTAGLKRIIDIASQIIPEDEIYLRVLKGNVASQKVMLKCGARRTGEDADHYLMRIPKKGSEHPMNLDRLTWTREPADCVMAPDRIEITTRPHTDLWQRTYYHFRNDNAPVLQMETEEKYFSFIVRTDFSGSHHRFDQCGIVMYLDSENWLKGSVEYENERFQHLGSVVTNHGYSDWATTAIPADVKVMWYRFSRREDDYCIECSQDGESFSQMRVCHMWEGAGKIRFGIYACSPEDSSFKAVFTHMQLTECAWKAHDGQQPDEA